MVEALQRRSILDAEATIEIGKRLIISPEPPLSRHILRCRSTDCIQRAGASFGSQLSTAACTATLAGDRAALWLGPDEWLLLAPPGAAASVARDIASALEGRPYSLVDVGHRQTAIAMDGPLAPDVLNAGCPLDLDLPAFPVGMCTRTLLGKTEIVLWRRAPERWHIEAARSFTPYVFGFLKDAAREYHVA